MFKKINTMIYLDYNATTPIDKEVAKAMQPFLDLYFGNPSSSHSYGIKTKKALEKSRSQIAQMINCSPDEIIFTSGGSESNNFAVKGYVYANQHKGNHIITSSIEHPAVTEVCKYLESKGFSITYLPVDQYGLVNSADLEKSIRQDTILITIMHANNEIGTIQPISELSKIAQKHNIIFHTDAAQSVGKYPVDVQNLSVDLLSIAGHKLYAPKGIGALYIRRGIHLEKLIHGADHEQNQRAGTENVLEIVGLGAAAEIAKANLYKNMELMNSAREALKSKLKTFDPAIIVNGHPEQRLPNTLSVSFPGIEANLLLNDLERKGIAASAGAACHTESIDVSPVLTAIQLDTKFAMGTIRFSTGKHTTNEEIEEAAKAIIESYQSLKADKFNENKNILNVDDIKLTSYTQGLGCACKLRPQMLEKILSNFSIPSDPNVEVGLNSSDDAAVYKINDTLSLVQTVDFFTPIVDNPYEFGQIATANALSDIYAMGARPAFALNIVGFPSNRLPVEVLNNILKGATDKAEEAGISILGGHTIDDPEPKFGMVVNGFIHPDKVLKNCTAKEGDAVILTKPIGTGILSTALKKGLLSDKSKANLVQVMSQLNKVAAETISEYPVSSCTDVTGFGLIGHLLEITNASQVEAEIYSQEVPLLHDTLEMATAGILPGGTKNNYEFVDPKTEWENSISQNQKYILCDAQTSGGLLFTIAQNFKDEVIESLKTNALTDTNCIGKIIKPGNGRIYVKSSK